MTNKTNYPKIIFTLEIVDRNGTSIKYGRIHKFTYPFKFCKKNIEFMLIHIGNSIRFSTFSDAVLKRMDEKNMELDE